MKTNTLSHSKITATHLGKRAYVYVRQASLNQVRHHGESTTMQYQLVERAVQLGWPRERVHLVDDDLGKSATSADQRQGFQFLMAAIGLGHVGRVMRLDAPRLARNNSDWYRLIELCAMCGVLIADAEQLYDARLYHDRLLLGLSGMMSAAELHHLKVRRQAGARHKAKRGALCHALPVGLLRQPDGTVILHPDAEVQARLRLIRAKFAELGRAWAVRDYLAHQGWLVPSRPLHGPGSHETIWSPARVSASFRMLHNPASAGASVRGHYGSDPAPHYRVRPGGLQSSVPLSSGRCAYPTSIQPISVGRRTWPTGLAYGPTGRGGRRAVRVWRARGRPCSKALSGAAGVGVRWPCAPLARAGNRCPIAAAWRPKSMVARIAKRFGALTSMPRLSSSSWKRWPLSVWPWHSPRWINSHGKSTPLSTNGNCGWSGYAMRRNEPSGNTRGDPDNRLVARVLESQWEEKLRVVEQTAHDYETWKRANRTELTSQERAEIVAIGEDLPRVWHAETTTAADRKHLLRLVVKAVSLDQKRPAGTVWFEMTWQSGARTEHELDRLRVRYQDVSGSDRLRQRLCQLHAQRPSDAQVAHVLNAEGYRTAKGRPFRGKNVWYLRRLWGLSGAQAGEMTSDGLSWSDNRYTVRGVAQAVGVSKSTVHRWLKQGQLEGESLGVRQLWRMKRTTRQIHRLRKEGSSGQCPTSTETIMVK